MANGALRCCRSTDGVHAKLRADISSLLALIEKSPLPAAAAAVVALHELLDAQLKVRYLDALPPRRKTNKGSDCQHRRLHGCPSNGAVFSPTQAATGAKTSHDATQTLRELAPEFGRALKRPGLQKQTDPPSQSAAPRSMTRVKRSAAAITLMIVQCVAGMPELEALDLLHHLRHAAPVCLR
jgi:hypothetical protein